MFLSRNLEWLFLREALRRGRSQPLLLCCSVAAYSGCDRARPESRKLAGLSDAHYVAGGHPGEPPRIETEAAPSAHRPMLDLQPWAGIPVFVAHLDRVLGVVEHDPAYLRIVSITGELGKPGEVA